MGRDLTSTNIGKEQQVAGLGQMTNRYNNLQLKLFIDEF